MSEFKVNIAILSGFVTMLILAVIFKGTMSSEVQAGIIGSAVTGLLVIGKELASPLASKGSKPVEIHQHFHGVNEGEQDG